MRLPRVLVVLACLAAGLLASTSVAQGGLAYTVQVAALSDPESAIGQSGALLRDGFPAYVVRAEGAAGTVFRVRVGAFGDRASADRYARAMGERAGGTPRPALAEAIPAGILPVAPTAVTRIPPGVRAVLLPWEEGESVALRIGPAGEEAHYEILGGEVSFDAWWASPTEAGRDEIVRLPLDDQTGADDPPEVREALFRQRLRLMAERSGLTEEALAPAVRGEPGSRYLVAWRSVGGDEGVHGLLAAGADPAVRDADAWLGRVPPPPMEPLEVLQLQDDAAAAASAEGEDPAETPVAPQDDAAVDDTAVEDVATEAAAEEAQSQGATDAAPPPGEPAEEAAGAGTPEDANARVEAEEPAADAEAAGVEPVAGEASEAEPSGVVGGEGWSADADGRWTILRVGDVSWRALVGAPRTGLLDLLVLEVEGGLEIVRLVPR